MLYWPSSDSPSEAIRTVITDASFTDVLGIISNQSTEVILDQEHHSGQYPS